MKPRSPIKRGKRPKPFSEKRRSAAERRQEVVRLTETRAGHRCEAVAVHALAGVLCSGPLDTHELVARSQWSKGYLDPANTALVCRAVNDWVEDHPRAAHALGFRLWSYERPLVDSGEARERVEGRWHDPTSTAPER